MIIGNDIIDLTEPPPHPRFFQRITSEREKRYFSDSVLMCHQLWAAKEAAFKAIRQQRTINFIPAAFQVNSKLNKIRFEDIELGLHYEQDQNFLHCLAMPASCAGTYRISSSSPSPAAAVRQTLIDLWSDLGNKPITVEQIQKKNGVPQIIAGGSSRGISLTHHGSYVAAAILALPPS
ncbi:4'-phosphopantetheinyl transferase family protein [Pseudobacteriovorax antillogorgiicola]|uniref:4'-phosphopantetheinyl transferase superfamily protein n=1 Tax=Pseudobacteriovorax antillogorgiicola TaxID=1513793 RepID=A0A1Y6B6Y9_9BACT|nr:4'-phosphopantetheinyl transferase superfamily protein [Pseudobacteriovorax antillogorgiicola]TCS58683.1 4'-phosphopantetheinyl transferase superfamily protein [Pseudobacteriovorax antillogorgiicola]SME95896.1 4'-phosphopantetheinyl transferase superfamily protein [Pseudobacteriovorax antillogorgiicola]